MQNYPVRTTHRARLTLPQLVETCRTAFGSGEIVGTEAVASYGALVRLAVCADGKELRVDVRMEPKVSVEVAAETVRRYNLFLETATGYTAKERAKRLRKSATAAAA
ncbi:MAG: DUF5611 family protein [Thermoplasmata archaeon]|nr:DUF5611 family protein [Thermoplasmata archaeon]